ncbi:MAG: sigma-70 family RNA polymerase sigma factor [Gammaproteobacteria bacterium]|nr:sigma-70 family RNA polymerase sigma factor [Gammaproteobacteria bacterium]
MLTQYQQAISQYRQRVFSFAYYSLRAREDAEDITQDVFIRLWQHWRKIDHDRMGAWLMRVAHNSVIDHVRRQKNERQRVDLPDTLEDAVSVEDTELESQEFQRHLETAISELNDPYRSILIMRDIQGLSYQEIEQTLNLSQSQVKVYLHRARRQLRENSMLRQFAADQNLLSDIGNETMEKHHSQADPSANDEGRSHVE